VGLDEDLAFYKSQLSKATKTTPIVENNVLDLYGKDDNNIKKLSEWKDLISGSSKVIKKNVNEETGAISYGPQFYEDNGVMKLRKTTNFPVLKESEKEKRPVNPNELQPDENRASKFLHYAMAPAHVLWNWAVNWDKEDNAAKSIGLSGSESSEWKTIPKEVQAKHIRDYEDSLTTKKNTQVSNQREKKKKTPQFTNQTVQNVAQTYKNIDKNLGNTNTAIPTAVTPQHPMPIGANKTSANVLPQTLPTDDEYTKRARQALANGGESEVQQAIDKTLETSVGKIIPIEKRSYDPRVDILKGKSSAIDAFDSTLANLGVLDKFYSLPKVYQDSIKTTTTLAADVAGDPLNFVPIGEIANLISKTGGKALKGAAAKAGESIIDKTGLAGEALGQGVRNIQEQLVYDAALKNRIGDIPSIGNKEKAVIDIQNLRAEKPYRSEKVMESTKRLISVSPEEAKTIIPESRKGELIDLLDNRWIDKDGNPTLASDPDRIFNPAVDARFKELGIRGDVARIMANNIDDTSVEFMRPRTVMVNGKQTTIGGMFSEENALESYIKRTEKNSGMQYKGVRSTGGGTVRGVENLEGAKETARKMVSSGEFDKLVKEDKIDLNQDAIDLFLGKKQKMKGGYVVKGEEGWPGFKDARYLPWDYNAMSATGPGKKLPKLSMLANDTAAVDAARSGKLMDYMHRNGWNVSKLVSENIEGIMNNPKSLAKMKNVDKSFSDIFQEIANAQMKTGEAIKPSDIFNKNAAVQYAETIGRMKNRMFMRDSLIDMHQQYGDGLVSIVPKSDTARAAELTRQGYSRYSESPSKGLFKTVIQNPTQLSTDTDFWLPNEIISAINGYSKAWQNNPALKLFQNVIGTPAMKVAMTTGKLMDALGFNVNNFLSGFLANSAMAANKADFIAKTVGAGKTLVKDSLGQFDNTIIHTANGPMAKSAFLDFLKKRGVIQTIGPDQEKYTEVITDFLKKGTGKRIDFDKMDSMDRLKFFLGKVGDNLKPWDLSKAKMTEIMSKLNGAGDNVNRFALATIRAENGIPLEQIVKEVKSMQVDYSAVTPLVKEFGSKMLTPFIVFTKAMAKNILNPVVMRQLSKINYAIKGQSREKRGWQGTDPTEVQREAVDAPFMQMVSPTKRFDWSRMLMPANILQMAGSEDREGNILEPKTMAAPFVKEMMGGSQLFGDPLQQKKEFLGGIIRPEDRIGGLRTVKIANVLESRIPAIANLSRIAKYFSIPINVPEMLRHGVKSGLNTQNESFYKDRKPWYQSVLPKFQDLNSGYSILVNKDNVESLRHGENIVRNIENPLTYFGKYKDKKFELDFNKKLTGDTTEQKIQLRKLIQGTIDNTERAYRMAALAEEVNKMAQKEMLSSPGNAALQNVIDKSEADLNKWVNIIDQSRNVYIPAIEDIALLIKKNQTGTNQ
jgi:hypothetical protein